MEKKRFVMTPEQRARILDASKPTMYIMIGGVPPRTPQQNADDAWRVLADELGFVWDTARPVPGEPDTVFEAEVR